MNITFTLDLPDDKAEILIASYAKAHGYRETILDAVTQETIDNPVDKLSFCKTALAKQIRRDVEQQLTRDASQAMKQQIQDVISTAALT